MPVEWARRVWGARAARVCSHPTVRPIGRSDASVCRWPNGGFMPHRLRLLLVLASLGLLAGCGGPFLTIPGGALTGTTEEMPASWAFTDEVDTVQLETQPADPYTVNIWVIALDPSLYVHAGANRSTWVEHIEADPQVRLRVDEAIYELRAGRVEEQAEFDQFSDAYEKKYGRRPRNESVAEAYLFRLDARR